jgi:hypothetical protein
MLRNSFRRHRGSPQSEVESLTFALQGSAAEKRARKPQSHFRILCFPAVSCNLMIDRFRDRPKTD